MSESSERKQGNAFPAPPQEQLWFTDEHTSCPCITESLTTLERSHWKVMKAASPRSPGLASQHHAHAPAGGLPASTSWHLRGEHRLISFPAGSRSNHQIMWCIWSSLSVLEWVFRTQANKQFAVVVLKQFRTKKHRQEREREKKGILDVIKIYNVFASQDTKDRVRKQSQNGREYPPVVYLAGDWDAEYRKNS